MPSIFHVRYTVPPMPLERDIAKFIKNGSIFYLIFRVYLVSQWNLGKMTSYTFHMLANWGPHANFQKFLTAHLRDRLLRYLFLYHSKGTKSAQDPTRASMVKVRQKTRPPRLTRSRYILLYVVEGHASACPRTVGVGNTMWRWRLSCVYCCMDQTFSLCHVNVNTKFSQNISSYVH